MSTVSWSNNGKETLKHIEGFGETLCGIKIPSRKEWSAFGQAECKRCIASEKKAERMKELEE